MLSHPYVRACGAGQERVRRLAMSFALGVLACATCGCGDPTLTTMGLEKPLAGRLRASTEVRYQEASAGEPGLDEVARTDLRLDTTLVWFATSWAAVSVDVPLVARTANFVNLGRDRTMSLGDIDARVKLFVWEDRAFAPRQLLAVMGGIKFPTAPRLSHDGVPVNDDAQPGTGSIDPAAGIAYSYFWDVVKLYASVTGSLPTRGWGGLRAGKALLGSIAVQLQPAPTWAVMMSADTRLEGAADRDGMTEPDTGGFVGYLSPRVVWSPVTDLLLHVRLSLPLIQRLDGFQHEGAILSAGATLDF
jgi:hypothetical protein